MRFDDLVQRVHDTERALELQRSHTRNRWRGLRTSWREGWTPTRIVLAGLLSGFLVGRVQPVRKVVGLPASRWVQIGTSLWTLAASFKAKDAATTAEAAAGEAGVAAHVAADTAIGTGAAVAAGTADIARAASVAAQSASPVRPSASDSRRRADPQWQTEPRPAEAATELSER
ncbi:hypothetical protein ACW5EG_16670 [Luteimonas sp. A611]